MYVYSVCCVSCKMQTRMHSENIQHDSVFVCARIAVELQHHIKLKFANNVLYNISFIFFHDICHNSYALIIQSWEKK